MNSGIKLAITSLTLAEACIPKRHPAFLEYPYSNIPETVNPL